MPAIKGEVLNPKGRGNSPNKTTKEIREAYTKLISSKIGKFEKWIDEIAEDNPEKAMRLIIDLSNYVIPKISQNNIIVEEDTNIVDYSKLSEDELIKFKELLSKCNKEI